MMQESDARKLVEQMQPYQQNGTLTRLIPLGCSLGWRILVQFSSGNVYQLEQPRAWRRTLKSEQKEAARLARMQPLARLRLQKMIRDTWEPFLARLERGEIDPKLSTVERYAEALGQAITVASKK